MDRERQRANRACVGCHDLTLAPIAAGESQFDLARLIANGEGDAVILEFPDISDLLHVEPFPRPPVKLGQLRVVESVV